MINGLPLICFDDENVESFNEKGNPEHASSALYFKRISDFEDSFTNVSF